MPTKITYAAQNCEKCVKTAVFYDYVNINFQKYSCLTEVVNQSIYMNICAGNFLSDKADKK